MGWRWHRIAPWLAPPATVLAILVLGHFLGGEPAPTGDFAFPEPPAPAPPDPPAQELALSLLRPDGSPAEGAIVMLLHPEPGVAVAGADGVGRLAVRSPGPYRLWAYLDGHQLLEPEPFHEPAPRGLLFQPLPEAPTRVRPPAQVAERRVRVVEADTRAPLAAALVLAGEHAAGEHPFSLAITGADGSAALASAPPGPLVVHVYAPLLPAEPAWRLASRALSGEEAVAAPLEIEVPAARIALRSLPAGELLDGARVDVAAALPLVLVPPSGAWDWPPLPPGRYRFRVLDQEMEADVPAGGSALDWSGASTRSGSSGIPGE
ncbi:MAG: hypothetical protein EYC70_16050 [Planctomycetota bacterium]|nr:MAG: hypothetical protein EYC70_16050 [Planctomycetota bacterium]